MDELIQRVTSSETFKEAILCDVRVELKRGEVYRDVLAVIFNYGSHRILRTFVPQMSNTLIEIALKSGYEELKEAVWQGAR